MLKRMYFLISALFILSSAATIAQNQITTEAIDSVKMKYDFEVTPNTPRAIVNACAYYKFTPRDTMFYTVQSNDSIVIDYGTPLLKSRHELLRVICDSVGPKNNHYYMNLSLIKYEVEEHELDSKIYTHSNSEWVNRNVFIEIDSVGNRFGVSYDDSTMLGANPGGPYQPYLFFYFEYPCQDTGHSWTVLDEQDYLVENGLPCPVIRNSYMFTNRGYRDTLGYKTAQIDFVKTAQGSITYSEANKNLRVTSVIASGGILDIGVDLKVPIHFYQTMEQKLTIHTPNGVEKPGRQYISSYFTLVSYNKYIDKSNGNKKNNKKKKK